MSTRTCCFAELARQLVAPHGRVGLLVPSRHRHRQHDQGVFRRADGVEGAGGLYDFENRKKIFRGRGRAVQVLRSVFGGTACKTEAGRFRVFRSSRWRTSRTKNRHIALSSTDLKLLNPNTRTCPIFRTRRDAELTKPSIAACPILIDHTRRERAAIRGASDSSGCSTRPTTPNCSTRRQAPAKWVSSSTATDGRRASGRFLPLYEAKMIQAYDHRAASVVIEAGNWVRQGQTEATTLVEHQNPEFVVQPRWWVEEEKVIQTIKSTYARGYIGFKDITAQRISVR